VAHNIDEGGLSMGFVAPMRSSSAGENVISVTFSSGRSTFGMARRRTRQTAVSETEPAGISTSSMQDAIERVGS
jgi:hypothetical protein